MPRDGNINRSLTHTVWIGALAPLGVAAIAIVALAVEGQFVGIAAVVVIAVALALAVYAAGRQRIQALNDRFERAMRLANEVATVRLPEALEAARDGRAVTDIAPIYDEQRDELGELIAALDRTQRTAVTLAAEQARVRRQVSDMFVDLGRRHQALLGRTLSLVAELESSERDPSTVTDLLRLDHLVTRMRRNAESLLVLAGTEPGRGWSEALTIDDVVRHALGEIEAFDRVDVGVLEPDRIAARAVGAVAHLAAELLENATVFSPPDSRVTINGMHRPDGYVLSIVDHGLGMKPEELAEANERLSQLHTVEFTPPRRLGLAVVAELARRHGMVVQLQSTEGGGTTASVLVPPMLLAGSANGATAAERPLTAPVAAPPPAAAPGAPSPVAAPDTSVSPDPSLLGAPVARAGMPAAATAAVAPSGVPPDSDLLPRRVRGEHIPDLAPPRDDSEAPRRDAPDVAMSLGGFQDGVQRARAERRDADPGLPEPSRDRVVDLVAEEGRDAGTVTAAGLEKRVAGAQLPDTGPPRDSSATAPPRDPDDVRNALTSFQHGVARGTLERSDPLNGEEPS
jgi:signal transduction histidine kinase